MGDQVLISPKLYVGGYDVSGDMSALASRYGASKVDDTKASSGGTRVYKGGMLTGVMSHRGMVNEGTGLSDEKLFGLVGVQDTPVIVGPQTGAAGEVCNMMRGVVTKYDPLEAAELDKMLEFGLDIDPAVGTIRRGMILVDATAAIVASGNGTAFQVGAVSATQKVYAALMVLAASGGSPTFAGILQSDSANNFPSPANVITFGSKTTAAQVEWQELAGANADTWWRLNYTLGGSTPSFTIVMAMAIF